MKALCRFALVLALAAPAHSMEKPSNHTKGVPAGKPSGAIETGEYWWHPEISPSGPVVVVVSIPLQTMHVYRNGVLIGRSTVSTGAKGHATPTGVFTILEKKKSHHSKKYNNAPMPNMQRLTWSGICMHSGNLPGYPASHGCIRMPYDFSVELFKATAKGGTVVIGDDKTRQPHLAADPGVLLAPKDFTPEMVRPLARNEYDWRPERSESGPITMLVSGADRAVYVYRNGNPIGRAPIEITGRGPLGGHVFTMLEGVEDRPSWLVPGRKARKWMHVKSDSKSRRIDADEIASRIRINPEFASKVYDSVGAGTTVIVTDQPAVRNAARDFTVLTN